MQLLTCLLVLGKTTPYLPEAQQRSAGPTTLSLLYRVSDTEHVTG